MFRSSKILIQNSTKEPSHEEGLNIKVSKLVRIASSMKLQKSNIKKFGVDDGGINLNPIEVENRPENQQTNNNVRRPPMPYRLTFKSRKVNYTLTRHQKVTYTLGFNSNTVKVVVETSSYGLRRVFVDGEELVRQQALNDDWEFSHFIVDRRESMEQNRIGCDLKVQVSRKKQIVSILADGFPVESLRRSSTKLEGSPFPPPPSSLSVY